MRFSRNLSYLPLKMEIFFFHWIRNEIRIWENFWKFSEIFTKQVELEIMNFEIFHFWFH